MSTDVLRVWCDMGQSGRVSKWFALPDQQHEAQDFVGKLQTAGFWVRSQRFTQEEMREALQAEDLDEQLPTDP